VHCTDDNYNAINSIVPVAMARKTKSLPSTEMLKSTLQVQPQVVNL